MHSWNLRQKLLTTSAFLKESIKSAPLDIYAGRNIWVTVVSKNGPLAATAKLPIPTNATFWHDFSGTSFWLSAVIIVMIIHEGILACRLHNTRSPGLIFKK